jgi:hypothetical protein
MQSIILSPLGFMFIASIIGNPHLPVKAVEGGLGKY